MDNNFFCCCCIDWALKEYSFIQTDGVEVTQLKGKFFFKMPHHVIPGVCDTKSLALYKISCGSSAQQDSISYMQKYMRTIMNFKSLIFMNHWCRAKSTAQSTQRAMSVIFCHLCSASGWRGEVLYQWACWGCSAFWMERSAFLSSRKLSCPEGGESHGPNKLPRADGVPF